MKKHIIWSNDFDTISAIAEDIQIEKNYTENTAFEKADYMNELYLDDERINLNINTNTIVAIGDLGFWNGRASGHKIIGNNIKECLYSDDNIVTWYVDQYNFKCEGIHHDGCNYITYRERKNNISDEAWDNFLYKIYQGKATAQDISKYTISLKNRISCVYGW